MVYKWYILLIGGLYATYHLLGEPETTVEKLKLPIFRNLMNLKLTFSLLKNDSWNTEYDCFPFGVLKAYFQGRTVSFRECTNFLVT